MTLNCFCHESGREGSAGSCGGVEELQGVAADTLPGQVGPLGVEGPPTRGCSWVMCGQQVAFGCKAFQV